MFCTHCGRELAPWAEFCRDCFTRVPKVTTPARKERSLREWMSDKRGTLI